MAEEMKITVELLIGDTQALQGIKKERFVSDKIGLPTIEDILRELEKPGRDPRDEFRYASFSDTVREIKDLVPGMKLEGTVTNVTNFGAFVDIGVHQDGLVHISQLADRYVTDPHQVVRAGQIVSVTVLEIDAGLKRISLSMKKDTGSGLQKSERKPDNEAKRTGTQLKHSTPVRAAVQSGPPKLSDVDRLKQWASGD
jgi:protein Tex